MVNRSSYKPHKIKNFKQNLKKDSKLQIAPKKLVPGASKRGMWYVVLHIFVVQMTPHIAYYEFIPDQNLPRRD